MYVCQTIENDVCIQWVEQSPSVLETLAITRDDAGALALAICSLLVLAYVGGLIGRVMFQA